MREYPSVIPSGNKLSNADKSANIFPNSSGATQQDSIDFIMDPA